MIFSVFVSLLLAVPALSNPLEARNRCNRDNVLRALVDRRHIDEALKFCRTYISVPPVTTTVSSVPADCPTRTAITMVIDRLPVTVTTTPTYTVTVTSATTTYTGYTPPPHYKRDHVLPTFVSQYPASRVSSACSCLTITPSTATKTQTSCPPPSNTVVVTIDQPPPTFTVTAASSVVITSHYTTTETRPALCKPTNFKEYKSGVDRRDAQLRQTTGNTEGDCCVTCYNAKDCVYFQFRPDNAPSARCEYYVGITKADPNERVDICPLGVSNGSGLDSPVGAGSGQYFYNYGPCLSRSPLNG